MLVAVPFPLPRLLLSPQLYNLEGKPKRPDADSPDLLQKTCVRARLCNPVLKGLQKTVINAVLKDESPSPILNFD